VVEACRHFQKFPTQSELEIYRRLNASLPSVNAIKNHFGGREGLVTALSNLAATDTLYADIAAMLPSTPQVLVEKVLNSPRSIEGFVYLIKSGEFYKIGRSDDIERRIKEIRIALPDKAILVHSIRTDDPAGIEAYWHNRFGGKRANGEWFKLSSLDLSAFRKRKYQ